MPRIKAIVPVICLQPTVFLPPPFAPPFHLSFPLLESYLSFVCLLPVVCVSAACCLWALLVVCELNFPSFCLARLQSGSRFVPLIPLAIQN